MDSKVKKEIRDSRDMFDPRTLFAGKAGYYQFRAHYSEECMSFLREITHFDENISIADVGAGTGILSEQLIEYGANKIFLIEPNNEMLNAAKERVQGKKIQFLQATAENTSLPDASIDLITVGTAFHWFDKRAFKRECIRIGREGMKVAILRLNNFVPDISKDNSSSYHSLAGQADLLTSFFEGRIIANKLFFQEEVFDEHRFVMERLSDQNAPLPGDSGYEEFVEKAKEAFAYFRADVIKNIYITSCIVGEL